MPRQSVERAELAGRYDLVYIHEALHDVSYPVRVLEACRALLGDGGTVIVGDERAPDEFDPPSVEAWLGARSWQYLLWDLEGLLKAAELATAAMDAGNAMFDAPCPAELLALMVVLVVVGELALYFAKGHPDEQ